MDKFKTISESEQSVVSEEALTSTGTSGTNVSENPLPLALEREEVPFSDTDKVAEAAQQLSNLKVKQPRLTTSERKRAIKDKLALQGIEWDPKKFNKTKNRSQRRVRDKMEGHQGSSKVSQTPVSQKRSRQSTSNPSSLEAERKRPKVVHQPSTSGKEGPKRSFKECLTATKMAIVPTDFAALKLNEEQAVAIEMALVGKLACLPDGQFPVFEGTNLERGALIVTCTNQATVEWLKEVAPQITLPGTDLTLKVGERKDILRATKVLLRAPAKLKEKTPDELLKLIKEQNRSIKMEDWYHLSTKEDGEKGPLFVFLVDDEVMEALKAVNFIVHVGLWKSTVIPIDNRRKGDNESNPSKPPPQ